VKALASVVRWLVIIAALGAFVVEALGTLPAPTLPLLAIAVVVPELAPRSLVVCVALLLAVTSVARGRARTPALGCAGLACALALVPLVEYPTTSASADAQLRAVDGDRPAQAPLAVARALVDVTNGVPVRTRDGATLALDVYRSPLRGPRPTVVTIYGGAWIFGTRADTAELDRALAARGYTVIAIDYRHAPRYHYPVQREDVADALATIARGAARWNVDPSRVALFGRSAGAELALLAAYEPGPLRIRAVVAYYAPTDLIDGYRTPPVPDPANVRRILRTYVGTPPEGRPDAYRDASPLAHVRTGLPPTLLVIGLRDALVRPAQQRALRDSLRAHGDSVAAIEIPWSNHAFDALPGGLAGTLARRATDRFLAATLLTTQPARRAARRAGPRRH